jgi:hypothetical protein
MPPLAPGLRDGVACQAATETISALADGERPAWRRRQLRRHLDRCASCRAFDDACRGPQPVLAAAVRRLRLEPFPPPPETLVQRGCAGDARPGRADAAAADARRGVRSRRLWRHPVVAAAPVAAAAVLLVLWPAGPQLHAHRPDLCHPERALRLDVGSGVPVP